MSEEEQSGQDRQSNDGLIDQLPGYWKKIEALPENAQVAVVLAGIAVVLLVGGAVLWVVATIVENILWIAGGAAVIWAGWLAIEWRRAQAEERAREAALTEEARADATAPGDAGPVAGVPAADTVEDAPLAPELAARVAAVEAAPVLPLSGPVPPGEAVPLDDVSRSVALQADARRQAARERALLEVELQAAAARVRMFRRVNWMALGLLTLSLMLANRRYKRLAQQIEALGQIERGAELELLVYCDPSARATFSHVVKAYRELVRSDYVWNVTGDRRRLYPLRQWPIGIRADRDNSCRISDTDGVSLAIFNGIAVCSCMGEQQVVPLGQLQLSYEAREVVEKKRPPADAQVIGARWEHALADGSRDETAAENRQYPLVRYGVLSWKAGGFHQQLMLSNEAAAESFYQALDGYIAHLRCGRLHFRRGDTERELALWLQLPDG